MTTWRLEQINKGLLTVIKSATILSVHISAVCESTAFAALYLRSNQAESQMNKYAGTGTLEDYSWGKIVSNIININHNTIENSSSMDF